jgi:putative endonuclease
MVGHQTLDLVILGPTPSPAAIRLAYARSWPSAFESNVPSVVEGNMSFSVYILRTSSNTLYIGQTNNLNKRLQEHRNKTTKSAKYIRYFNSFQLVYSEIFSSRKEAMHRELQLKQWSRTKKEALIKGDKIALKKL